MSTFKVPNTHLRGDDALGLLQVARKRDNLLGRLVVSVSATTLSEGNALNESGQVGYSFRLADGYQGVAIWSLNLPGDFNQDDTVDAADYVVWRKTGGTLTDYDIWKSNFGNWQNGDSEVSAAVPEPACPTLLVIGVLLTVCRGGRFRPAMGRSVSLVKSSVA
jgi:hypothetical protein